MLSTIYALTVASGVVAGLIVGTSTQRAAAVAVVLAVLMRRLIGAHQRPLRRPRLPRPHVAHGTRRTAPVAEPPR
jgi:hypothetical protein